MKSSLQNRFNVNEYNITGTIEPSSLYTNVKSNLFFDDGNRDEDLIFGQQKKEEPIKESERPKQTKNSTGNDNEDSHNITQENRQENFLDYDVNTNNNNQNKKSNFFDDGDIADDDFNKSQNYSNRSKPVTGENAIAKNTNNEQINNFLNPESGATQNIEKNNKNNFFDEEDDIKNTFNLFSNQEQNMQKNNKIPNKKISGGNNNQNVGFLNKSQVEKKIEQKVPQKLFKNKGESNLPPKKEVNLT